MQLVLLQNMNTAIKIIWSPKLVGSYDYVKYSG